MSIVYNPITDFLTKDTLPKEDPDKVILGADFSAEFDAISTAFLGAAPTLDPSFTGTVTFVDANGTSITVTTVNATDVVATGNVSATDVNASGDVNATGDVTATNVAATGTVTAGGAELQTEAQVDAIVQSAIATAELGPISTLGDLSNVDETGKLDGDFLVWDNAAGNWVPQTEEELDLSALTTDVLTTGTITGDSFFENFNANTATQVVNPFIWDNIVDTGDVYPWSYNQSGLFCASDTVFFVTAGGTSVYKFLLTVANDISTAAQAQSIDTSSSLTNPLIRTVTISPDGTKLLHDQQYSIGTGWKHMHQWTLSTPFDLSTATYDGSYNTGGEQSPLWNDDGTVLYTYKGNTLEILATTINVPYDLIGSTSRSNSTAATLTGMTNARIQDSFFNLDGTKYYATDGLGIHTFDVSTPYDLTTVNTTPVSSITNSFNGSNSIWQMTPNAAGTRVFMTESGGSVTEINSYDITTTNYNLVVDCDAQGVVEHTLEGNGSITFTNLPAAGTSFAITVIIRQDAGGSGYTVTWPAGTVWAEGTAPVLSSDANAEDVFVFMTNDGGTTWYGFTSGQAFA
jgi:hypothetical protein